jgi:hypothetical protein
MAKATLSPEQTEHFDRHIAGIGHNLGPALQQHAEEIHARATAHPELKKYATEIRVMVDMLRSHLSGERPLPAKTSAYVFGGLALVATMTSVGIATGPISTLLLDSVVIGFTATALHDDIEDYVAWRAPRDPAYQEVRRELAAS